MLTGLSRVILTKKKIINVIFGGHFVFFNSEGNSWPKCVFMMMMVLYPAEKTLSQLLNI